MKKITEEEIKHFIDGFGVREDEPLDIFVEDNPDIEENDPEMMINFGFKWLDKYNVYIDPCNSMFEERDNEISDISHD